jgi:hypothetical protein
MATDPSPRPSARLVAALGWIAGAAIIAAFLAFSLNFRWMEVREGPQSGPYAGDFVHEYAGGWIVREGESSRIYDRHYFYEVQHDPAVVGHRWRTGTWALPLYPPFYYVWCVPLALLDYRTASLWFTAFTFAALVASTVLIAGADRRTRGALGWWFAASACYVPVLESLVGGQKGTVFLLVFALTYRLLARKRLFLAGAVFALASVKPQLMLVLLLVMLLQREWRFFAGLLATGAVLGAQSLIVGWQPLLDWISSLLHPWPHTVMVPRSHNWLGFARLLLGEYSGPAVGALWLALVAATGCVVWRVLGGRLDYESRRFRVQFAAIVLATPLVSPHLYTYDLSILVLPLIALALEAPPAGGTARALWLAALGLVFLMGGASPMIAALIPIQGSSLAVFAMLLVLMRYATPARAIDPAGAPAPA